MIMVTLGSQKFQFNRLLHEIDILKENGIINDEIIAQIGYSNYIPKNYQFKQFIEQGDFSKLMEKADIIITHGGTGVIINALKKGKKVIAFPRLSKYDEHVDDHQKQIVKIFVTKNFIFGSDNVEDLKDFILQIDQHIFNEFKSNNTSFVNIIDKDIMLFEEDGL